MTIITTTTWHLAATMPHANSHDLAKAGVGAALSNLELGESLHLVLAVRSCRGPGPQFAVRVAHDVPVARASPLGGGALEAIRFANPAFQFEPMARSYRQRDFARSWQLHELAGGTARARLGFQDPAHAEREPNAVMKDRTASAARAGETPAPPWKSIDEVLAALSVTGNGAELRLSWHAVALPAGCRDEVSTREQGRSRRHDGQELQVALQLDVRIHADSCLPATLLKSFGMLAFETPSFLVRKCRASEPNETSPAAAIRVLRYCDDAPPGVLPSPDLLIRGGTKRRFADAPASLPARGTPIGAIAGPGKAQRVTIPDRERSRHVYMVGATGTGKSTMLLEMLRGDMGKGAGVMLVDPHGDLFNEALAIVPPSRRDDLVVLDASPGGARFSLNVLSVTGMPRDRAATFATNELLAIFASLYDMKACGGPMFELYFTNAMSLVMNSDLVQPSLSDLARVFEDVRFRRDCIEACNDPVAARFWRQTAAKTSGDVSLENMAPYIFSKVNRFVQDANLRPILAGRESGIDLRDAMDRNRIILVNLAKGQIGAPGARFLGMAIMMRLLAATLGRANVPEQARKPFFVHVDEFQSLATEGVGTFLAEARKFGVCMTLASQTLAQLRVGGAELADTVTGNCGTMIMTRLGPRDADSLARTYGPDLTASDMQSLPSFHAVGRFLARDIPPPPFVFKVPTPRRRSSRSKAAEEALFAAGGLLGSTYAPAVPSVADFSARLPLDEDMDRLLGPFDVDQAA